MFTVFLIATAAVVSALLLGLLLKPRRDAASVPPLRIPVAGLSVAAVALALAALGFWLV